MTAIFSKIPRRAAEDHDLTAADHRVLTAIGLHANGAGTAYPSLTRIAAITGIDRKNIPRSLSRLEAAGLLRRVRRRDDSGGWDRSTYEVVFEQEEGVSSRLRTGVLTAEGRGCPQIRGMGVLTDDELNRPLEQTLPLPPLSAHGASASLPKKSPRYTAEFETFWRIYPSRRPHPHPKEPAALKFAAALKLGVEPEDIIAGAKRYAAYVAREVRDPRYIVQAATWLHQKRWNDQHEVVDPPPLRVGMN
jgi:MarR family